MTRIATHHKAKVMDLLLVLTMDTEETGHRHDHQLVEGVMVGRCHEVSLEQLDRLHSCPQN